MVNKTFGESKTKNVIFVLVGWQAFNSLIATTKLGFKSQQLLNIHFPIYKITAMQQG